MISHASLKKKLQIHSMVSTANRGTKKRRRRDHIPSSSLPFIVSNICAVVKQKSKSLPQSQMISGLR